MTHALKYGLALLLCFFLHACQDAHPPSDLLEELSVHEKTYVELGGVPQYVEVMSSNMDNPVLLFVHGGPAWPQTPQLRYFNAALAQKFTLVIWEQRGAGKSFEKIPQPANLTLQQIVKDGVTLSNLLRTHYEQDQIYLAGYSWGSLVGVQMAAQQPEAYKAYIGISQFINKTEGMRLSRHWLRTQATAALDTVVLTKLDSLENPSVYQDDQQRFKDQYALVDQYRGAVYQADTRAAVTKATTYYQDYKNYDWEGVWETSAKKLEPTLCQEDVRAITALPLPVYLLEGRHDWDMPAVLAEQWLQQLEAPKKKLIWFEKSAHGPLEEEPEKFNRKVIEILKETY